MLKNYAIFITHDQDRSQRILRYLRASSDQEQRSLAINDFLKPRYPGYTIHEVREIASITNMSNMLVDQLISGKCEIFSLSLNERLRRAKRKIDGVIEEMKIRAGDGSVKLGTMIHGSKLVTYRVIYKRDKQGEE